MKHLGVFAKYWEPGAVKTRLARDIGPVRAATLYREFVLQTLARFAQQADQRSLWVWPPARKSEFEHVAGTDWTIHCQPDGDLGLRMSRFFCSGLQRASRVVLIGSDSPNLPTETVNEAWLALAQSDVVLGPAIDGGYYLVGMRTDATDMFEQIPWSTPDVLPATMDRLSRSGTSVRLLDPWRDVDTLGDLEWLRDELNSVDPAGALEQRLLQAINLAVEDDVRDGDGVIDQ